jgi:uncharacterized protein
MYKLSSYNYFVEDGSKIVYFNGMSGAIFAMSGKEHERMTALFDNLLMFKERYPSVFGRFLDWGFFVPEDADEIATLRFNNKKAVFSDKFYRLIMNPTTDCIFNCWYCSQHSQDKGGMSKNTIAKIRKHIDYMVNVDKITGLHLDCFGGEPLMYFNEVTVPLSEYGLEVASKNGLPFVNQITTNAYLIDEAMAKKMSDIKLTSFQITIDGDEKRHNKIRNAKGAPSFQRIMQSINLILENIPEAGIVLRLNYDDSTLMVSELDKIFSLIPEKYRSRVFPNFQRIWQTVKKHSDSKENKDLIKLESIVAELGYKAACTSAFHTQRAVKCYADRLYNTVIDYDGKVYKCTANTQKEAGILNDNGEITWHQDVLTRLYSKAPFENKKCLACKHLPICLATCVQNANESDEEPAKCTLDYAEISVEDFIRSLVKAKVPVV